MSNVICTKLWLFACPFHALLVQMIHYWSLLCPLLFFIREDSAALFDLYVCLCSRRLQWTGMTRVLCANWVFSICISESSALDQSAVWDVRTKSADRGISPICKSSWLTSSTDQVNGLFCRMTSLLSRPNRGRILMGSSNSNPWFANTNRGCFSYELSWFHVRCY